MIKINILFPNEKKRIVKIINKRMIKLYDMEIKKYKFYRVGDLTCTLSIYLEDKTFLSVTVNYIDIENTMTICDDFSM